MTNKEIIDKAVEYIDSRRNVGLTVEDVALNAGFSIDYFNKIFFERTGFNVMEYVRFRALHDAAYKLRMTDENILSIALDCGYGSHDGFTRAFKAQFDLTPSEFRENKSKQLWKFADDEFSATLEKRFIDDFPEFRPADISITAGELLMKDLKKYALWVCESAFDGMRFFCSEADGVFVGITKNFKRFGPFVYLLLKDTSVLYKTVNKLQKLEPHFIRVIFEKDISEPDFRAALGDLCRDNSRELKSYRNYAIFIGEKQPLPPEAAGFEFRYLQKGDEAVIDKWAAAFGKEMLDVSDKPMNGSWDWGLKETIARPFEKRPNDRPLGMFREERLVSVARTSPMEFLGVKISDCITIYTIPEYKYAEKAFYIYVMNTLIDDGFIPCERWLPFSGGEEFTPFAAKYLNKDFRADDVGYVPAGLKVFEL